MLEIISSSSADFGIANSKIDGSGSSELHSNKELNLSFISPAREYSSKKTFEGAESARFRGCPQ